MSTQPTDQSSLSQNVSLRALAEILVRQFGLHKGRYTVAINFQIGVGHFPSGMPDPKMMLGAMMGVTSLRLDQVSDSVEGEDIVDAAVVNPVTKAKAGRKPRSITSTLNKD